ncbi:hypothetical protein BJ875DRAFT_508318 [Amylocarpus encephaloides]|uniref:SPT2 chromatin protein n=1 Tax=Amylocarpus encephaloides TaxID=45428 RepID=A0A9P8C022_9HELO|nr:hypothetical protein BJ875DRAFT_508318 [Amylocarpus encephaloides]
MPIGDLLASISGEASPTTTSRPLLPTKRKSYEDEGTRRPTEKQQKANASSSRPPITSRLSNPSTRPPGVDTSMSRMKINPLSTPNSRTLPPKTAVPSSRPQNGQPTPPVNIARAMAPPKKGSFAEIMARGHQAQSTMGQVGKIQHKRIEKTPSKRERSDMEARKAAKIKQNIGPNGKFRNTPGAAAINNSKTKMGNGKTNGKSAKALEPEKKVKKAALATTGYAGTARPKPGAKPGSKLSSHASSSRVDRDHYGRRLPPLGSRQDRYDSYEDDEEDEDGYGDEDGQPDYESDVSSDMEAAAFEVDEEEEFATRVARKEDAEALAEENRLKKEKAEKKKRLMALAAKKKR